MGTLLPFLVFLLAIALFTRVELFFTLLYVLFGIVFLGRLWSRRALEAVEVRRVYDRRMFQGEMLNVRLAVANCSRLPVLWMRLHDAVPATLGSPGLFRQVISLGPRESLHLDYCLRGNRRGYYRIGPLVARGGDLMGFAHYEIRPVQEDADYLIVYPRIVPLRDLGFPSQSPFGVLPSREHIFEDPTRIRGVRDYRSGDSLRRIDWKTSSRTSALQVKRYEPAIALETGIFLNLNGDDYPLASRAVATEMSIVVAASVAAHLVEKRQAVALATNGRDAMQDPEAASGRPAPSLPLRTGREHLTHLLDLMARIEIPPEDGTVPFLELVREESLGLPWGSTALLITGRTGDGLFDTLLLLRRRGLGVILVMTCPGPDLAFTVKQAAQIGVQAHLIEWERHMDLWR